MCIMKFLKMQVVLIACLVVLAGCAVAPRVGLWEAPKRYTKNDVFNAIVLAGVDHGLHLTIKDKDLGIVSFWFRAGDGEGALNFQLSEEAGQIVVRTSSAYGGILAIAGELENNIRIIYKSIYEKLNINDVAEKNLQIKILND